MQEALKITGLSFNYGKKEILKNINITVNSGEVFGLLGPNGAGKTTIIKLITGLLNIQKGEISIIGSSLNKNYEQAMEYLGAIVENPEMYGYMTGYQNIMQYARIRKNITKERINEVVELVGLSNRINDKVKKYSLGMRQRLGVALALLHNPKILILDEPTNGLDPVGIKNLRDILIKIAHEKDICVIVSSHLMSEMEMMCDRIAIIKQGEVLTVDSLENLLTLSDSNTSTYQYEIDDTEKAIALIKEKFTEETVTVNKKDENLLDVIITSQHHKDTVLEINRLLIRNDIPLYTVNHLETRNLEEAFIDLTSEGGTQIA